ncbi:MAG: serine hydrolase [Bacteroidetes bacterium]|nr:serine hydrolase [Bacteroidota bacterium]
MLTSQTIHNKPVSNIDFFKPSLWALILLILLTQACKKSSDTTPAPVTLPVLSTTAVTDISSTGATSGGNITSEGSSPVTSRGVVWGTSSNPTIVLPTKTSDGSGSGIFTSNLTGLTSGARYYVRAYATSSSGTAYGNEQTFTATAIVQNDIPVLDGKIAAFMSTYNIPGASLAVSKNGKLVYMKGYGFADQGASTYVTPAYRFRLASVTKTYTGVAIMKLFQEGKLDLDGKVFGAGSILGTDFGTPPYNPNLTAITVRMLLQHITGAWGAATGGDVIDQNPAFTNKQQLDWIIDTRPMPDAPGSVFDYSNINYFILGRIIEKITGQTYYDYIHSIMTLIGATDTEAADKTLAERKPLEVVYYGQGTDAPYVYNIAFPRRDADAGLIATAKDLLKLITAVDGFNTRPDILNASTITQFITPSSVFSGYACGIGIWSAQNLWFNDGSLPGTRSWFMRHDNGMCVAILLNSRPDVDPGNAFAYAFQALELDIVTNASYSWQDIDQF